MSGRSRADRTPTEPITVAAPRPSLLPLPPQPRPRTAPLPLPTRFAAPLSEAQERCRELLMLHAAGRVGAGSVAMLLRAADGPWRALTPAQARALGPALGRVLMAARAVCTVYVPRLEQECPVQLRCADGALCAWHRAQLKRLWNGVDPLVRALWEPKSLVVFVEDL